MNTAEQIFQKAVDAARVTAAAISAAGGILYAREQLEEDWRLWMSELLPKHFRYGDERQFAVHHDQLFQWGWGIEQGEIMNPPACVVIINRGGNKSTSVAGLAVALGAMQKRKFGLVITRTESQGDTHVGRVNSMLLGSKIGQVYPGMTKPKLRKIGKREVHAAWNRTQLTTADGWTLQNFSLEAAQRGVGLEEYRPDLIWLTDLDDEKDGPGRVDTFLGALSASVLGTRSADCVVVFEQNLIHRDSIINRILTRKTDVLSDRLVIGPVPAVKHPQYERQANKWVITSGTASWEGMPLEVCQTTLNVVGMQAWEREYQHNIMLAYADAVYGGWDEVYHIITQSEFERYFQRFGVSCRDKKGVWRIPERGNICMAQDWGNRAEHPCANRWCWRPAEGMPIEVLRDVFFYREMCFPRFPLVENDDRRNPSALMVGAAIQDIEGEWETQGRRMVWRLASHERPEIVRGYIRDLPLTGRKPLTFRQIDTARARSGILHMQNFLAVDYTQKHPFRCYPAGHPEAGMPLQGKPRIYFVVEDGQGELSWDAEAAKLLVRPAVDERGQARTRFEYPNYRKPDTAEGAEKKDPLKRDDDMVDCDRAIAGDLFPSMQHKTIESLIEEQIPEHLREEAVEAMKGTPEYEWLLQGVYQQRVMAQDRVKRLKMQRGPLNVYEKARLFRRY